jgi:hypothetical protein
MIFRPNKGSKGFWRMSDPLLLILILVAWFALQRWILPRLGVST